MLHFGYTSVQFSFTKFQPPETTGLSFITYNGMQCPLLQSFVYGKIADHKIVGNSFQPIGGLITGNCIHQGFRWKITVGVFGQIGNIQFPRILWYVLYMYKFVRKTKTNFFERVMRVLMKGNNFMVFPSERRPNLNRINPYLKIKMLSTAHSQDNNLHFKIHFNVMSWPNFQLQ